MAHNPRTFPEVSSQGTILDTGKEAFFAVSATYTESRYYLRNIYTLSSHQHNISTHYLQQAGAGPGGGEEELHLR